MGGGGGGTTASVRDRDRWEAVMNGPRCPAGN